MNWLVPKYSLKTEINNTLIIVVATITAKTTLPPNFHPRVVFINHPQANEKTDRINQTAKFKSPNVKSFVSKKLDANIKIDNSKGVK